MKTREEISAELPKQSSPLTEPIIQMQYLQLAILLDIRDLLGKLQPIPLPPKPPKKKGKNK